MYAFVHVEKTAGTTLNSILRRCFGSGHCDIRLPMSKRKGDLKKNRGLVDAADLRRVQRIYRHLKGIAGHNVVAYGSLAAELPELRFFTFLRDPVARFRSHFLNRCKSHTREDFDRWIAGAHNLNWQTRMIAGVADADKAIELMSKRIGFVGLTERFDESVVLLKDWLQEPEFCPDYRPRNQLKDKRRPMDVKRAQSDMSYLDSAEGKSRIRDLNAEDQRLYDYVTSTVFPRQCEAYRGHLAAEVSALQELIRQPTPLREPLWSRVMRGCIYKPLLHCRAA